MGAAHGNADDGFRMAREDGRKHPCALNPSYGLPAHSVVVEEIPDLVVDRARVPHASLRIEEELAHGDLRMRERIFEDLAGLGIEPAERVLLVRRIPDHVIAIDADGVGTGLRAGQPELLELPGLGIEAPDLAAAALAEPDDAVRVHLQSLRLALGGRIELGQHALARD